MTYALDFRQSIINEYISNKNLYISDLALTYNISPATITLWLRKEKINTTRRYRKYTFNQNYFDVIDTEEKAYFLGFLYADGCNCLKAGTVSIELQERDKHILEHFKELISADMPLHYRKNPYINRQDTYKLIFQSFNFCHQLSKLGCLPNKSLILTFPTKDQVPKYLLKHFIRGHFDGDGCISFSPSKYYYSCFITSTLSFCREAQKFINKEANIVSSHIYPVKTNPKIARLYISNKNNILQFTKWLYEDSSVFLERKYQKYQEIKKYLEKSL